MAYCRRKVLLTIRDVWQLKHKNHQEFKHMNRALVDRLLSLIPVECEQAFIALTFNPKMTFLPVFEWFYDQHGVAMEEEIVENTAASARFSYV